MNATSSISNMKARTGKLIAGGVSLAAVAAIVVGAIALAAPAAETTRTVVEPPPARTISSVIEPMSVEDEQIAVVAREAARVEAERIAAEAAAAEAARVAAEQAAAQAEVDRIAAEQADAQRSNSGGQTESQSAAPGGPIKCPPGSSANSGDGGNDTSCFPDICFHITLPDAAHPECNVAFKP